MSYFNNPSISEAAASRIYDVLAEHSGASKWDDDRASFIAEFTGENPTHEYRFQGNLGFGGKFRFPRLTVDCYPEDSTPEREAMIAATNERLAAIKDELGLAD